MANRGDWIELIVSTEVVSRAHLYNKRELYTCLLNRESKRSHVSGKIALTTAVHTVAAMVLADL